MKTLKLVFFLALFALAACNGSSTTQVPYSDPALVAKVDALTKALAAATHADAQKFSGLQIIGKLKSASSSQGISPEQFRTMGETSAVAAFGPCSTLGVMIGHGTPSVGTDPLSSNFESFQQCTGYEYTVDTNTDNVAVGPRLFWDGPNCTGNPLEWDAGGAGYNNQVLQNGVVFLSPTDGTELMVQAGQTPQPILIQSAWVTANPGCQSDVETQLMYTVTPNNVTITGIPNNAGGQFQLSAP